MTFTHALSTNNYGSAKFIVDANAANGTHTTIASALTSASSGDTIFIRPGTYTENLTLKAGVNLTAYTCDQLNNVTIVGKFTATFSGLCCLSGLQLQTNSDYCIEVTGSNATIINLFNCLINSTNNTGIHFTSSNVGSVIGFQYCQVNIATTGIAYHVHTSAGFINYICSSLTNTGLSTVISSNSSGNVALQSTSCSGALGTTSTGGIQIYNSAMVSPSINLTMLTSNGTGTNLSYDTSYESLASSCISIGSGSVLILTNATLGSSNTNAISGSGTLKPGIINFIGTSSTIQNTLIVVPVPPFTVKNQVFTSNGTYTPTLGMFYCSIQCLGGGGGGGGAAATGVATFSTGMGGGSGEYAVGTFSFTSIGASQSVTIGAGGAANSGTTGGNGGTTSVGSLISCGGGSGGLTLAAAAAGSANGGNGGTGGTGGDYRTAGNIGLLSFFNTTILVIFSGNGANSQIGAGGAGVAGGNGAGSIGSGYGSGGGGASNLTSQSARSGGAGTAGVVIVTEYVLS